MATMKTGLVLAAAAASLFLAGCATQSDGVASAPAMTQTNCGTPCEEVTAKDRMSCKAKTSCSTKRKHHKKKMHTSMQEEESQVQ